MAFRLVQRRTVLIPTLWGWVGLFLIFSAPLALWFFEAEAFFSLTDRQPAEVLVVEGWIGYQGVRAALVEFKEGGYQFVVTAGGLPDERSGQGNLTYAEMSGADLVELGIPEDRVITAPPIETKRQRTFVAALAVWQTLRARGVHPKGINVFTLGAHARRSRLVYAKVFGAPTKVGAISWIPANYGGGPWWRSSERAEDVLKETAGYLYEALLNSGRSFHQPDELAIPPPKQ